MNGVLPRRGDAPDRRVALVVSPHPDDELIPAGGTLLLLRDAGWRIVNLACSLGRPSQIACRRAELERACVAVGFELDVIEPPVALSRGDDLDAAAARIAAVIADRFTVWQPSVVVAPGPRDGHHAHEAVAQAVARAVVSIGAAQTVWWWELWGQLSTATLLVPVESVLDRVCAALAEHRSQLARNDYERLVRSRANVASVLGPERVFGFGHAGVPYAAAEILCETAFDGTSWRFCPPRSLAVDRPSPVPAGDGDASAFVAGRR
jgi:LmbE family N-acetylglucosaminyl deacetylase